MDSLQQAGSSAGQQVGQHAPYYEMMSDKCKSPTAALTCPDAPASDHTVLNGGQAVGDRAASSVPQTATSPSGTEAKHGEDDGSDESDDKLNESKNDIAEEDEHDIAEEDDEHDNISSPKTEDDIGKVDVAHTQASSGTAYSIVDILNSGEKAESDKKDDKDKKDQEVKDEKNEPPKEQKLKANLPNDHPLKEALHRPILQKNANVQDLKSPNKDESRSDIYSKSSSEANKTPSSSASLLLSPSTDQYKEWLKQQQKLDLKDDKSGKSSSSLLTQLSPSVASSYLQGQAAANLWYQNMAAAAAVGPYPYSGAPPYADPVVAQIQAMYPTFVMQQQPESRVTGSNSPATVKSETAVKKPKEKSDAAKMTKEHEKLYHCIKCPRYFFTLSKLVQHESTHPYPRLFNCGLNLKRKRSQDSDDVKPEKRLLMSQLDPKQSTNGYMCVLCSEKCPSSAALQVHITQTHRKQSAAMAAVDEQQQYYRCSFCSQFMASRADLMEHEKIHIRAAKSAATSSSPASVSASLSKPEIQCKSCTEKFTDLMSLREHEKIHHMYSQPSSGSSSTSSSPHQFSRPHNGLPLFPEQMDNMKSHQNILQDCLTQGKMEEMNRHDDLVLSPASSTVGSNNNNNNHSMGSDYSCPICKKQFVNAKLLKSHVKYSHLEERPYTCTVCSKSFKQKATLKQHEKLHSDEKPYICNICSRGFVYPSRLKTHAQTCKGDPVMSP